MKKRPEVPLNYFFKASYNPVYENEILKAKKLCYKYNHTQPTNKKALQKLLGKLIGKAGKDPVILPPFWCDYGYYITLGDNFYANHGMVILDGGGVSFGDNVFVAPNCTFTTAEHAIDPELRRQGAEIAKPIKVGNNVWIGADCTILAGVEIGDNSVIGAGSVVTKSIPSGVVAVGVPCRVMREITEEDKLSYPIHPDFILE